MASSLTVSFQIKRNRNDSKGRVPIFARLTVNEQRCEFSIKRSVDPEKWLSNGGMAKGNSEEIKNLNAYLTAIRLKLHELYRRLLENDKAITPWSLRNAYFGKAEKGKTIIEIFEYHNYQVKSLINKEFSQGTYERYCTALSHVKEFIQWKYNVPDLEIKRISYEFITEFEYYLKTVRKCNHNTAIKYITNLKKIIRICIGNGWLDIDPFTNYKITLREVEREYLTIEEIDAIADKQFAAPRLEQVRDVFVFCCYTGLAYADAKKFSKEHLVIGIDGKKWIKINRTKTDTRSSIPLLPPAAAIIRKYEGSRTNNKLLPVLSNQKTNAYLKEIADICDIKKNLTFHLARHTFATTITLTNGVSIESVSRMLGHKSIRITQHYAKIVDRKLSDDMAVLHEKFAEKEDESVRKERKIS